MPQEIIDNLDGIGCPNCGYNNYTSDNLVSKTEPEFNDGTSLERPTDPFYEWTEVHKCPNCETLFRIKNGT